MTGPSYSYYPAEVLPQGFRVIRGDNDLLFTDTSRYIDLLSGSGTVFLGHANPAITGRVRAQLDLLWNCGAVPTQASSDAWPAVEAFFPPTHRLAVLYSTGMEAAEFALRAARQATGRRGAVGFAGAMHGKSMAAARLGWPNALASLPDFQTLPYLPRDEGAILEDVRRALGERAVAAVFLEPLLGSRGGFIPSREFAAGLAGLCRESGSLLILDEIFTGFHRTGPLFLHHDLGVTPDIVLIGKAIGNGFPVSGVVMDRRHDITGAMLPGSTFAGNPLAAATVTATLAEIRALDLPGMVRRIEQIILGELKDLGSLGIALRGKGALWVLELPDAGRVPAVMAAIVRGGVIVSQTASYIRLLPAATITPEHLAQACRVIREACQAHR